MSGLVQHHISHRLQHASLAPTRWQRIGECRHRQAATRGGVLGVYRRGSRWPEQMRGKILAEAITGTEVPVNVVPVIARVG